MALATSVSKTWPGSIWRFLVSVRLALILILVLAGLSLIGSLVIQVPGNVAGDPDELAWWIQNVAGEKLGRWAEPLEWVGLLDVFHSPWFLGAGALLIVNILACSINRWAGIRHTIASGKTRLPDRFYEGGANRAEFSDLAMPVAEATERVRAALASRGYRTREAISDHAGHIAADKNRYFVLGTYLHHVSIVLLIVGYLIGSYWGFRDLDFVVPEGSVRDLGHGSGLSLGLESFVDEYWPEGPPSDYRSDVVLYENGVEVRHETIRVNHPLIYKGIRIYQSFFGPAAALEIRDAEGRLVFDDAIAQAWLSGGDAFKRPTGSFRLPDAGLTVYVVAPAQGRFDPLIEPGQQRVEVYSDGSGAQLGSRVLEPRVATSMAGYEFTFIREHQFSGFQVSRDPGNSLIWISSGLFVLGLFLVFYLPHRQVWARAHAISVGRTRVVMRTTSTKTFAVAADFEGIVESVGRRLSEDSGNS